MNISNYLAELWGITIVVVSLALLIKPKRLERLFVEVENEATMFFWGIVSLVIGIAMVLLHNVWVPNWRVVITILGWLTLIKGVDVLFLPDHMRKRWPKMGNQQWQLILVFLLFIGLVLTYLGFTA
ncbi:MAG: hypothetical protein PHW73_03940 [Atribacterota bacterium]|nr:hypothetical protein [Atribacterota bacterium]